MVRQFLKDGVRRRLSETVGLENKLLVSNLGDLLGSCQDELNQISSLAVRRVAAPLPTDPKDLWQPFPAETLPGAARELVTYVAHATDTDPAMTALPVLLAAPPPVQDFRDHNHHSNTPLPYPTCALYTPS